MDLHPEEGCGGPLDLHLALDVDPRVLLSFEDAVVLLTDEEEPPDEFHFPLTFTWALPPLPSGPDLLRLAIDLAGVGGIELPLEVSAIDSFANATDGSERRLSIVARHPVSLARVLGGEELLCDVFDRVRSASAAISSSLPTPGSAEVRHRRLLSLSAVAVGLALTLSACDSNNAQVLARQACVHVERSLAEFAAAEVPGTSSSRSAQLLNQAESQLRVALPIAAHANSADGSWNSLMTTISEEPLVGEAHIVPALRAQCVAADANPNVNPNQGPSNGGPATTVPQNVNPKSPSP